VRTGRPSPFLASGVLTDREGICEEPTRYQFVVNLKTAKALGLTIPPSVLARTTQLIE
jgi:hypothetical protein